MKGFLIQLQLAVSISLNEFLTLLLLHHYYVESTLTYYRFCRLQALQEHLQQEVAAPEQGWQTVRLAGLVAHLMSLVKPILASL